MRDTSHHSHCNWREDTPEATFAQRYLGKHDTRMKKGEKKVQKTRAEQMTPFPNQNKGWVGGWVGGKWMRFSFKVNALPGGPYWEGSQKNLFLLSQPAQ